MGKINFTIKIFIIVLVAFLVISSWSEVITKSFFQYFDLDKEKISSWFILGIVAIIILFIVVFVLGIEIHDFFGISETVDVQITGLREKFKNGRIKHY